MNHDVIRKIYSNASIVDDEAGAFDIEGNQIEIDVSLIEAKTIELLAEAEAEAQAKVDARQSALNKLMALGLTEEEALALGVK